MFTISCLRSLATHRIVGLLLCAGFAIAVAGWIASSAPSAPRAPASLLGAALERPDATFSVIVQENARGGTAEGRVAALGGKVTKDLWLINAFAAELPGRAVSELAHAEGIRWISLDEPLHSAAVASVDTSNLQNAYVRAIGADRLWNEEAHLQGQGVAVAVVDSGIAYHPDLDYAGQNVSRIVTAVKFSSMTNNMGDQYGHGTHIAGIVGGDGLQSQGTWIGVAPKVNLVNVKVTDDSGSGSTSDVVAGLQWVYKNKTAFNIRVLNLSLNSRTPESYDKSPLDAALEVLWFSRIVVVVSVGNNGGDGQLYPPANDPFIIAAGAVDDRGTPSLSDDVLTSFSASGTLPNAVTKPDLVAPGKNLISLLSTKSAIIYKEHPAYRVDNISAGRDSYFRMSGTSAASAVVAGAAALLLQANPALTPDQVKYRLQATARPFGPGSGAGYLDIFEAVHSSTIESANKGLLPSALLSTGTTPMNWGSVNWESVNWESVNWESVNWDSVNWDSVNWDRDYWGN